MSIRNKACMFFVALLCLNFNLYNITTAAESENKYPDYSYEFMGPDKYENFNRKMFIFNSKLNKYVIRPVNIIGASIIPKYGMDRLQNAYANIEFPKRLASCLIQKDMKASKKETLRFLTNSTLGLGGLYDPAKKYFNLEPVAEDMDQALAKCKVKQGSYLVIPILTSTSPRDLAGKVLECALEPTLYLASPIAAFIKTGLLANRTSYRQSMTKMIESTYADPYDIAKKLYGIEKYIRTSNLDRINIMETSAKVAPESAETPSEDVLNIKNDTENNAKQEKISVNDLTKESKESNSKIKDLSTNNLDLRADMILKDYNPQNPVVDSMRTALFELPGIDDSIWAEISLWNRCFSKQIKTSSINIDPERENYKYRYILQKDRKAPIAIIYPSLGEGIMSHHSVVLAKLFYDEGYSVIIQGSHFQWEFVKSMPKDYKPGIPSQDADYLKMVTSKILNSLHTKYNCEPSEKVVIGTSFGAFAALFLADKEYKNNTMNITKYISINPPIEILFALKQLDKNNDEWNKNPSEIKQRTAVTAAKILQIAQSKEFTDKTLETLPFSEEEARLITGFIMRQKLSDLIFTIENASKSTKTDIYHSINNTSYNDYAERYLLGNNYQSIKDLNNDTSLYAIADFLKNSQNYKIYHTLDDYYVNPEQLKQLKTYSGNKVVLINNGSHLGFLYRQEFIAELKKDISLKNDKITIK